MNCEEGVQKVSDIGKAGFQEGKIFVGRVMGRSYKEDRISVMSNLGKTGFRNEKIQGKSDLECGCKV